MTEMQEPREFVQAARDFFASTCGGYRGVIEEDAARYRRELDLKRVLHLWQSELDDQSVSGTRYIIAKLCARAMGQHMLGKAGSWAYNINTHLAVLIALRGELTALEALEELKVAA